MNILKHRLVPEHTIMKDEDVKELLEKFNISINQLPKILNTDPVVKAIGAKVGDVLKIVRNSPTAGKTTYYRLVSKEVA
ncbi:MAG: DNA-directed RNA polymerase subunit H [Candidatus Aenigmarchaeota archaeon]|nr:DNA-directed RNA polymerase subunit H [Candidatus Aenigmarchaeota archaeon]